MDPRGHGYYEPSPLYHPSLQGAQHRDRDRDDAYYRPQPAGQGHYPPPDLRERERPWYPPDPRYRQYLSSPPPKPEFFSGYNSIPLSSQSYGASHAHSHSRQAYDYPPRSYWDYRDDYGYYNQNYYRGHLEYQETSGWPVQEGWHSEVYHSRGSQQEYAEAAYSDQKGYGPRRDSVQYDDGASGRERSKILENGNEHGEVYEPGNLASSKTSGLSSSSYELSQYMNGAEQSDTAPTQCLEPEIESKAVAPLKFCVPHVAVSFGPSGQLVRVSPTLPSHGEPAQVELHSLEVILSETKGQQDMRTFPGPLAREDLHKVDVMNFALQMADACLKDKTVADPSSAALLWHLLVLLCRQNGRIVGSDIAELLVRGRPSIGACEEDSRPSDVGSLIDLSETPTPERESLHTSDLLTGKPLTEDQTSEKSLHNYTKLLLAGRKKEALESAMRSGLWGHALFLASKMDSRAYTTVLSRFTGSLAFSDPLQTLFQLLSGRIPTVATCYSKEKWGDWRPHLAVMLSNETGDSVIHCKSIVTLGDTLASRGLLHAAHICYLTAHSPFGWYTNKADRLVLFGSSHSVSFAEFCQNSSIHCTEVFEYSQRLGDPSFFIPSFQVYKFIYACRLLACGMASQAFHYCEVVAKSLLTLQEPHVILLGEVIKLVDRLKYTEAEISETGADLDWLVMLRQRLQDMQMGSYGCSGAYVSAAEDSAWAQEDSGDLNPDDQSRDEEVIQAIPEDASHNSAVQDCYEYSQTAAQQPQSFYPPEEQSYPSYTSEEHSNPSVAQPYIEEQPAQTYAPVSMYSIQNTLATPLSHPLSSGLTQLAAAQDGVNQSHDYHTATSLIQRSRSNTGVEFPTNNNMINTTQNGTCLGGDILEAASSFEAETKETSNQKSEKGSKSGWFSGWFRSKPKESPQDESTQVRPPPMTSSLEPTPILPPSRPYGSMTSPSMLPLQPQEAGINPFSRRAGQKPCGSFGPNLPQGP
ncbi:protein transport protein Sec16B [Hoplias malabaricus]|uniref:protein transport protein Sec16B n=1 Tax=Hoplias malabaricus TaxID=27720 RepID=UPI0034623E14